MNTPLDDYKSLVDDIVERREDVTARWVTEKRPWPDIPENKRTNEFVASLDDSQRTALADMLQHSRDGGIHDLLCYLNEQIDMNGLRLTKNGIAIPHEPFGSEMNYDWTCRKEGDAWPDPENAE